MSNDWERLREQAFTSIWEESWDSVNKSRDVPTWINMQVLDVYSKSGSAKRAVRETLEISMGKAGAEIDDFYFHSFAAYLNSVHINS